MNQGFLVVLPVLVVFTTALLTRKVIFALLLGVVSAGFIACGFAPVESITLIAKRVFEQTGIPDIINHTGSYGKICLFGFLTLLGILVELLTHAGGIHATARRLLRYVKNARQAQTTTLLLSIFFFIDDSLNALMLGAIMRPLSDFFRVPRIKLAYLFNSVASSLALIILASSWTGVILAQLEATGVNKIATPGTLITGDSFYFLLQTLPFMIYPFLSIFAAAYVVRKSISFGAMREQEIRARETGDLFGGKACTYHAQPDLESSNNTGSILDIIMPIVTFMIVYIFVLLYSGGYVLLGGAKSAFDAIINANNTYAFFWATLSALAIAATLFIIKKREIKSLVLTAGRGILVMKRTLAMLLLAWTFSYFLEHDLGTGSYMAHALLPLISLTFAPVLVFCAATVMVIGIGSSWATIALLIPVVLPVMAHIAGTTPLAASQFLIIAPTLGALLSGTVAGSQFSPITDAGIIAALGAQCNHLDHVRTMASYALPTLIGGTVSFVILGYAAPILTPLWASLISFAAGIVICISLLHLRNHRQK